MTNRTKIINANSLHTVESLRRWASCCFSQPVSRMLATVLEWLTDFLTGAIMESQKAARSKAVASPRCARQSRKHEFEKGFELKNSTSLLYLPISSSVETWKIFRNMLCQFFFAWADILSEKNPYFGLITRTSFAYKTSWLVRISLLINALNKRVLLFFSGKLFYKSNRKLFSCVCISWYKHSRGWENSRQLCKPSTLSRVCIILPIPLVFISGYANTENVFCCLNISYT